MTKEDKRTIEEISKENALDIIKLKKKVRSPFRKKSWHRFISFDISEVVEIENENNLRAYRRSIDYLHERGFLTTLGMNVYIVTNSLNRGDILNPKTQEGDVLYFVGEEDARTYSSCFPNLRVKKIH